MWPFGREKVEKFEKAKKEEKTEPQKKGQKKRPQTEAGGECCSRVAVLQFVSVAVC